jgi:hypothetical protein
VYSRVCVVFGLSVAADSNDTTWMAFDFESANVILNDYTDIFDSLFDDKAKIPDDDLPGLYTSSDSSSDNEVPDCSLVPILNPMMRTVRATLLT